LQRAQRLQRVLDRLDAVAQAADGIAKAALRVGVRGGKVL
jgi:hypothetical protein